MLSISYLDIHLVLPLAMSVTQVLYYICLYHQAFEPLDLATAPSTLTNGVHSAILTLKKKQQKTVTFTFSTHASTKDYPPKYTIPTSKFK